VARGLECLRLGGMQSRVHPTFYVCTIRPIAGIGGMPILPE
jgi:hypothetical protein